MPTLARKDGSDESRTIRAGAFTVEESGCEQIHPEVTGQSTTRVLIMLLRGEPSGHPVCPMIVRNALLTASLSRPLGRRMLVFESITDMP